jgi:hypothetical protein
MAQLSFFYDNLNFYFYFDQKSIEISNIIISDILYTARVIAAWYIIKLLWKKLKNYWLSVLIGAELTFVVDYYIFGNIAYS